MALGLGFNLAQAATHEVANAAELITAITASNASGESDTIILTGNILLDAALPDIDKGTGELTIEGGGSTLSRNAEAATPFRLLTVTAGVVLIEDLTLSGGNTTGIGGGIFNAGTLTMTNCTVSDNTAGWDGGGIYNEGTLTLNRSIIAGNTATYGGAEIYLNQWSGTINADNYNVFGDSSKPTAHAFYNFTPGASDVNATSEGTTPTALASILNPTLANNGGPTADPQPCGGQSGD